MHIRGAVCRVVNSKPPPGRPDAQPLSRRDGKGNGPGGNQRGYTMKSTICTEGGAIVVETTPGRVQLNGRDILPHEAFLLGAELQRAAGHADEAAAELTIAAAA